MPSSINIKFYKNSEVGAPVFREAFLGKWKLHYIFEVEQNSDSLGQDGWE